MREAVRRFSDVRRERHTTALLANATAAGLMLLSAGPVAAQTWTGNTSNDWTVGSNWNGGTVPVAGTVIINTISPSPTVLGVTGPAVGLSGNFSIGVTGAGNLTIQNGSTLTTTGGIVRLGLGGNGTVTVTGDGSQWNVTAAQLVVGLNGVGTLNITNGARVTAQNGLQLGGNAGSSGTLNISGGGILETTGLSTGLGTRQYNFDNAIVRALASNPTLFFGGTQSQLNIAAGGLTVDTNGFTVGTLGFSGVGGLTKVGAGTFSLRAASAFMGETVIQEGTLALVGNGTNSIVSSSRVVANATFDISGLTSAGTNIQSLAGSGTVTLGTKDLTITNANDLFSGVISGTGDLTLGSGTQALSGANSYTGATNVNGGTLRAGAANTFSAASAFSVASSGTLDFDGFNQTLTTLSNAGVVNFGSVPGTTLTITGDYAGANGFMRMNTRLEGDASPTDRLVVQGNTAGDTTVKVTNIGGAGAQTVEGIKIIDVGGTSAGIFALQGDYVFHGEQAVIGGAYAYTLHKNGVTTPTDGDWYLRSELVNPPPVVPSGPLYQPGVALYESYPQILLQLMSMPTMRDRLGDRYVSGRPSSTGAAPFSDEPISYLGAPSAARYDTTAPSDAGSAWWGRLDASRISIEPGASTAGATYRADQLRLQTGFDAQLLANADGKLMGGVTVQHGTSSARAKSFWGNGKIDVDGYGIGGALTWYGLDGFYLDGQAQVNRFDTDIRSSLAGTMAEGDDAIGYGFSMETGKRFAFGGPWAITPQAQLAYTRASFDFFDSFATSVSSQDGDSLLGRLGLALDYRNAWVGNAGPARSNVYGIANLYHEFSGGTSVDVAGVRFRSEPEDLWGGLGLGGTYSWAAEKYALYGEVSVNTSLDNFGDNYSVNGTTGFRVRW